LKNKKQKTISRRVAEDAEKDNQRKSEKQVTMKSMKVM